MSLHPVRVPSPAEVIAASSRPIPARYRTISLALAVIGAIVFVAGLFLAPDRVWPAFHFNWLFFSVLSTAGVVFVAVQRITTARWSRGVIRLMEGYVAFLPIAFLFLVLILLAGKGHIFWWTHEAAPVREKTTYFNGPFLITRDLLLFGTLCALAIWYIYSSVRLDVGRVEDAGASWAAGLRARMRNGFRDERREIHSTHSMQGKLAVVLVAMFAISWSVLSWDLSMGLSPHFQSSLYSWWFFMGGWLCALMLFSLLVRAWDSHLDGAGGLITENHFHDVGKLCFAFTAFWGYLTFGQYLVIWYGNLGEETFYPRLRLIAPWKYVSVIAASMVFLAPFFGLLSRAAKVKRLPMTIFALTSLVGMWFIRYIEVYPSVFGHATALPFGIWEVGMLALYLGAWGWSYIMFMDAFPRMRVTLITSPFRDEVQIPVNPETMEPLPAHE
ncbi:MAG TPA: hypothetical protein VFO55_11680 [Gemmatimonadaceae bacterium]|nr:hypothetical protein [Gemmatimonadaceae bacterium]